MNKLFTIITLILLCTIQVFAQTNVKGKVTDKNGEPLPGVNVVLKQGDKTIQGVITDMDGNYTLTNVPADASITFTFMGMTPQTIQVKGKSVADVTLQENVKDLDEVVVVGYGTQKRAHLTGSVSTVTSEELKDIPSINLSSALEGKLSGVSISQASGKPGAATTLQIRSNTSYGIEESVLYVIDDIIRDQEAFDILDPSEVESISVLKDASATIYGVRGAAGVVLVKTKKGTKGKIKVNYSGSYGITKAINTTKMLNAYELGTIVNDKLLAEYNYKESTAENNADWFTDDELTYFKDSIPGGGYNWLDNVWHNGSITHHSLNMSGGSDKVSYFFGGNYLYETGAIDNLYASKYSFRGSVNFELSDRISGSFEATVGNNSNKTPLNPNDSESDLMENTFKALMQNPPWIPPTINGKPYYDNSLTNNPYAIWQSGNYNKNLTNSYGVTGGLNYKIPYIKGLTAKFLYNYNWQFGNGKKYVAKSTVYQFEKAGGHSHIIRPNAKVVSSGSLNDDYLQQSVTKTVKYQSDFSLNYANKFGLHDFSAMAIFETSKGNSMKTGWQKNGDQIIQGVDEAYGFDDSDDVVLATDASRNSSASVVTRFNYNYGSKYLFEYNGRLDASTKFAPENRWGYFPSISVGWVASEENFFKQTLPAIDFFKIRSSVGLMGNDNMNEFTWLLAYSSVDDKVLFGDDAQLEMQATNTGYLNRDVSWQKTIMYNGGLDLKFLNNKLGITCDGFYKYTYDILTPISSTLPATTGVNKSSVKFNYGIMHGYGYEIEIKYNDKLPWDFKYEIKGNFSWAVARRLKVAQSAGAEGTWYDYLKNYDDNQPGCISLGIMRTEEQLKEFMMENPNYKIDGDNLEAGMLYFKDIRGANLAEGPNGTFNNEITEDRTTIAKHTSPVYHYGTTITLSWKGLSVQATLSGKFGHKLFYDKNSIVEATPYANVPGFWKDHWTPQHTNAKYPRAYKFGEEGQYSTFWMRNGHTLRITDLNVSYSLPAKWAKSIGMTQLRTFFNSKYLLTLINPFDYKDADLAYYNGYPMTNNFTFGLSASF